MHYKTAAAIRKLAKQDPHTAYAKALEDLAMHLNGNGLYTAAPEFSFSGEGRLNDVYLPSLKNKAQVAAVGRYINDPAYIKLANKLALNAIRKLQKTVPKGVNSSILNYKVNLDPKGNFSSSVEYAD